MTIPYFSNHLRQTSYFISLFICLALANNSCGQQSVLSQIAGISLRGDTVREVRWEITPTSGLFRKADRMANIEYLGQDQNLEALDVFGMCEDQSGNIWIGGKGGLIVKFNQQELHSVHISGFESKIESIVMDLEGNLWFGGWGTSLLKFNGKNFVHYDLSAALNSTDGVLVWKLFCDSQGRIWVGTNSHGAGIIIDDQFFNINEQLPESFDDITSFTELDNGHVWLGSPKSGIVIFDDSKFYPHDIFNAQPNHGARTMTCMKNQEVWVGFRDLQRINTKFGTIQSVPELEDYSVWELVELSNGTIFAATNRHGIISLRGDKFTHYTQDTGLPGNRIITLISDGDDNIWFGTFGEGIGKVGLQAFDNFNSTNGLQNDKAWSVCHLTDNSILVGYSGGGIDQITPNGTIAPFPDPSSGKTDVHDIFQSSQGAIWIAASEDGVFRIHEGEITNLVDTVSSKIQRDVFSFAEGLDNAVYAGGFHGLRKFTSDSTFYLPLGEQKNAHIWEIDFDEEGNLWMATSNHGLLVLTSQALQANESPLVFKTTNGNIGNDIFTLKIAGSRIYVGSTNHGLAVYDRKELLDHLRGAPNLKSIKITVHEGMISNSIRALHLSSDRLWIGTLHGICSIELNELELDVSQTANRAIRVYDESSGMVVTGISMNNVIEDEQNRIWWCSGGFLSRYNPTADLDDKSPPLTQLTQVSLHDQEINSNSADSLGFTTESSFLRSLFPGYRHLTQFEEWSDMPQGLALSYDENDITFDFNIVEWCQNEHVQFRTRLQGQDNEWGLWRSIALGAEQRESFNFLPPGNYTFGVQARNSYGILSEPDTFNFQIMLPFWKTKGFIIGLIILVAFVVVSAFRLRLKRLEKENIHLENTVLKRTEELRYEKKKSDDLLLNILPASTADELKEKGAAEARNYDEATVLFSDFKGFTQLTEEIEAKRLVESLHQFFESFDQASAKYEIEKIKTIGDSYMCASGIPTPMADHAKNMVLFGLEMLEITEKINQTRQREGLAAWPIRIGIHSGPLIAGVVGQKKFAYDIWGDTVNTASRMESSGAAGKLNISKACYEMVKNDFIFEARGQVAAKNKGMLDMYFVSGIKPNKES
ncbi:MAG: class 3 adenylate cyclase/ligand-binding sensor domain-containing protein [Flavobacteriales bacterium]